MQDMKTVLIIDDEPMILSAVAAFLTRGGFRTLTTESGEEGLRIFSIEHIDCVRLDLMLPDLSGEEICRRIRKVSDVPVIMLTAKNLEEDILDGFALGADDYIVKPFRLKELQARVTAVLHRWHPDGRESLLTLGDLTIDPSLRSVTRSGREIPLTPVEWNLLDTFVRHPKKIFTRDELILAAFGEAYDGFDRSIDTHIKNLRRKLEDDPRNPRLILTVYGLGYRLGDSL